MLPGLGTLARGQGHGAVIFLKFRAGAALLWWPQWKKNPGSGHTPWVSLHAAKGRAIPRIRGSERRRRPTVR